jgi:broad specificity phosphatase PhoE
MKLYLIRHSKTIRQPEVPNEQWVLSDEGVRLAEAFAKMPEMAALDIIYSSMQTKALQTAIEITKRYRHVMRAHLGLTELTSITAGYIEDYEGSVRALYRGDIDRINGGETIEEAKVRFNRTVEKIVRAHADLGRIGIVAHGNVLSIFASQFEDRAPYAIHQTIQMPDLAILDWETKTFERKFAG